MKHDTWGSHLEGWQNSGSPGARLGDPSTTRVGDMAQFIADAREWRDRKGQAWRQAHSDLMNLEQNGQKTSPYYHRDLQAAVERVRRAKDEYDQAVLEVRQLEQSQVL